ncbi:MAG TPA: CGNR zinc finger domain-containing protein [Steroidobacteraceae bacterium]
MQHDTEILIPMTIVSRAFSPSDLVGGHPALDLVNTVTARNTPLPLDWMDSYERLLEWARLANVSEERVLRLLRKQAAGSAASAVRALTRIKQLREALHTAYVAVLAGKRVPEAALDQLEVIWQEAQSRRRLEYSDNRIDASVSIERSGLDLIRDSLTSGAIELLRSLPTDRVRVCRGDRCGWLFIDSSKGGQRVWCDMATCGNAAKTRRHYQNAQGRRRIRRGESKHESG